MTTQFIPHGRVTWLAALLVCGILATAGAQAETVVLGSSGWAATYDDSWIPYLSLIVDDVSDDTLYLQKSAEFVQPPVGGVFPPIPIQFHQIAWPAVHRFMIVDEIITNSTGCDWTDFHWLLLDGQDAVFNADLTFASGFYTSPFDNQEFNATCTLFSVDGFGLGEGGSDAIIPNGGVWFPGDGASDGELVIDVVPHEEEPYTVFTLKETPTPEPSAILLLGASLALIAGRRRS
ncbi:MAG: PEP-CTERM sorting domain-containing protein [Phycisphaerae bacterium]|jgi:hypothetical protein